MKDHSKDPRRKALQELASTLPFTRGEFSADDVRVRLGRAQLARRRWGLVAAAVLALAVTHTGAFLLGGREGRPADGDASPIAETERILTRASQLDAAAPHDVLRHELGDLRRDIRLASMPGKLDDATDRRAARFADALSQLELALDGFDDPGFRVLMVAQIARASLNGDSTVRMIPASAHSYARVTPLGGSRFRFYFVDATRDRVVQDEGTLQELRRQYPDIQFVSGG